MEVSTRPQFVPGRNNVVAASWFRILTIAQKRALEEIRAFATGCGRACSSSSVVFQLLVCDNKGIRRLEADHRPLHLDLFCGCVGFRLVTAQSVLCLVWGNDLLVAIDLRDAYLQVPVHPQS